jgi:hypothetical protein
MIDFLRKNYPIVILACVFSFAIVFSLSSLTTKPDLWFDEALNIEVAHNFLLFQKLNILIAPGVFAEYPYMVSSSGYVLTVPLAGFFKIFGFGLVQARIFMLLWLFFAIFTIYFVAKSIFGNPPAILAVLFIVTFSPFYANGLTVMGDIPGFIFLLWGIFFLIKKENFLLNGLFFGLAAATKPSIYLLLLPAFLAYILILKKDIINRLTAFILGSIAPILLYSFIVIPRAFSSMGEWFGALKYYQNPYGQSVSLWGNVYKNLYGIIFSPTLIYFIVLIAVIAISFWYGKKYFSETQKKAVLIFSLYGFLVFLYFLRSPGWLRYLLPFELLVFIFVYPALSAIFKKLQLFACVLLILVQIFQLFFISDMRYFKRPRSATIRYQETALFINNNYPGASVGLFDLPEIAAFIASDKKYHVIEDVAFVGENSLSLPAGLLPTLIVFRDGEGYLMVSSRRDVLEKNYFFVKTIGVYKIFHRL